MILFKKRAKHKVKSYIHCVHQLFRKKRHKKRNKEYKEKQSLLFNFRNIFDLLTSRTEKIVFLNLTFTYFPKMKISGKFLKISSTSFDCIIPP